MQKRPAALSRLPRRREHIWSMCHSILTFVTHSAAGCGGWFTPTMCAMLAALGSDRSRVAFIPQTNRTEVKWWPHQDAPEEVVMHPFWCAPQAGCCVHTGPNESRLCPEFDWADCNEACVKIPVIWVLENTV